MLVADVLIFCKILLAPEELEVKEFVKTCRKLKQTTEDKYYTPFVHMAQHLLIH